MSWTHFHVVEQGQEELVLLQAQGLKAYDERHISLTGRLSFLTASRRVNLLQSEKK